MQGQVGSSLTLSMTSHWAPKQLVMVGVQVLTEGQKDGRCNIFCIPFFLYCISSFRNENSLLREIKGCNSLHLVIAFLLF